MDAVTQEYIAGKVAETYESIGGVPADETAAKAKMVEDHYRFFKAEELFRHRRPEWRDKPNPKEGENPKFYDPGDPIIDMECGWNIFLHDGECFATAWGWTRFLDNVEFPEWAKDYCYWNNTDPLDGFEDGDGFVEWQARGEKWDEVLGGFEWERRLILEIFNTELSRAHVSLTELQRRMQKGFYARALGASIDDKVKKLGEKDKDKA